MWRARDRLFLEPGEVCALAEAARQAAARSAPHPRQGLLRTAAAALDALGSGPGLLLGPAPASAARRAARLHMRPPGR